eukprot:CAMPEP_0195515060 /NCGR_PEP_ID=MMETSP0794_2-20130614/6263_1 /TAXON_ID=515487 /ORGANISM="Stephanopyxis turris, Strain CCMP 815" /LENGTH=122 /DNA_ID=CAMNT_0040643439 /DNA_START=210 /DNA_END=578 /DNA_ORIENTATION=+
MSLPASRTKHTKTALSITQPGSNKSAMIWCGNNQGQILGYHMHLGGGGRPSITLDGHLDGVQSMVQQENYMRLYTGSNDGMVLGWGCNPIFGDGSLEDRLYVFGDGGSYNKRKRMDHDEDCW